MFPVPHAVLTASALTDEPPSQQPRVFGHFYNSSANFVTVNKTALAYGTGAVLASGFLAAAIFANFPKKESEESSDEELDTTTAAPPSIYDRVDTEMQYKRSDQKLVPTAAAGSACMSA